uniref:Uncharacterized protein n=1 Tax=Plectus sambesii TaxID=2011161 RepID=A0A914W9V7_9BILA
MVLDWQKKRGASLPPETASLYSAMREDHLYAAGGLKAFPHPSLRPPSNRRPLNTPTTSGHYHANAAPSQPSSLRRAGRCFPRSLGERDEATPAAFDSRWTTSAVRRKTNSASFSSTSRTDGTPSQRERSKGSGQRGGSRRRSVRPLWPTKGGEASADDAASTSTSQVSSIVESPVPTRVFRDRENKGGEFVLGCSWIAAPESRGPVGG